MFSIGTDVEVRELFCGRWARGFQVAETSNDEYVVRRVADHALLPVAFGRDRIRRAD